MLWEVSSNQELLKVVRNKERVSLRSYGATRSCWSRVNPWTRLHGKLLKTADDQDYIERRFIRVWKSHRAVGAWSSKTWHRNGCCLTNCYLSRVADFPNSRIELQKFTIRRERATYIEINMCLRSIARSNQFLPSLYLVDYTFIEFIHHFLSWDTSTDIYIESLITPSS